MSRFITLTTADGQPLGNAVLPSEFPGDPGILVWEGKTFASGLPSWAQAASGYTPAPGQYESYVESEPVLTLPKDAVSPVDQIPSGAWLDKTKKEQK